MPGLPSTAVDIADLVKLWPSVMPVLRDQGEADRMNEVLGALLDKLRQQGKEVPNMPFVSDEPPTGERAALLGSSDAAVKATWFAMAAGRYHKTTLFRKFWESLSDDDKMKFFVEVPRA